MRCVKEKLCWVCGEPNGKYIAFILGPMCTITRTTGEPPGHVDCMNYSLRACPFLVKPRMVRREDDLTESMEANVSGIMLKRNPGVSALWTTVGYGLFKDEKGLPLIRVGEPISVEWFREGRGALRAEVIESIEGGIPSLVELCEGREEDLAALKQARSEAEQYLPTI